VALRCTAVIDEPVRPWASLLPWPKSLSQVSLAEDRQPLACRMKERAREGGVRKQCTGAPRAGAHGTRIQTQLYLECYCACRRHQDCHCGKRRLRNVADFWAALGQAAACLCLVMWGVERKEQWRVEKLGDKNLREVIVKQHRSGLWCSGSYWPGGVGEGSIKTHPLLRCRKRHIARPG
jgi:hypothetical protein